MAISPFKKTASPGKKFPPADKDSASPCSYAKRIYDALSFVNCLKLAGYTYRKTVKSAVDSFLAAAATSIISDIPVDEL